MRFARTHRPQVEVGPGERVLAWANTDGDVVLAGTRDAVYLPHRVPWEEVESVGWDAESTTLRISEVGEWGEQRPEHAFVVAEPGRFLQLVRERVTASVVYQCAVAVADRRHLRVIARRAPGRPAELRWIYEYDDGVDPADPAVRLAAAEALATAQEELGER